MHAAPLAINITIAHSHCLIAFMIPTVQRRCIARLTTPADLLSPDDNAVPDTILTVSSRALVMACERLGVDTRPMLDSVGIAHENGLISGEEVRKPDSAKLRSAASDLGTKFPMEDVSLYLSTLVSQDPDTWGELAELPQTTAS